MESDIPSALLKKRIEDEGYEIAYNPIGDGMCFYDAVAYLFNVQRNGQFKGQVNAITVQDKVFEYLMKHRHDADGNDNLDIISSYDLGNEEVPTSWEEALDLLKKNYANYVVIKTLPDVLPYTLRIITDNGANRKDYNKVFEPKKEGSSVGTLHLGYYSEHYVALKPSLKKIPNKNMASSNDQGSDVLSRQVKTLSIDTDANATASTSTSPETPTPLEKPLYKWFKDHPWENSKPSETSPTSTIEDVQTSKKYAIKETWTQSISSVEKVNFVKILNDLPAFLKHMQTKVHEQTEYLETNTYQARSLQASHTYEAADQSEYSVDVDGYMLKISIPAENKTLLVENNIVSRPQKEQANKKRWIFIPSYLRASCALFDWTYTGIDDENTIRIVVVRPDQYDDYIKYCGRLLPIISLPKDEEGAGYARHWIQKIATEFGLPYIWMIDDSVKQFYEVHPNDDKDKKDKKDGKEEKKSYEGRERSFEEVFQKIERLAQDSQLQKKKYPLAAISPARFNRYPPGNNPFTYKPPQGAVYLNISAINKKGIKYRPQLKVFEDMLFGAECVHKGQLSVVRWNRVKLYDMPWKNSGAHVFSSKTKNTKTVNTETATRKNIDEFFPMQEEGDESEDEDKYEDGFCPFSK